MLDAVAVELMQHMNRAQPAIVRDIRDAGRSADAMRDALEAEATRYEAQIDEWVSVTRKITDKLWAAYSDEANDKEKVARLHSLIGRYVAGSPQILSHLASQFRKAKLGAALRAKRATGKSPALRRAIIDTDRRLLAAYARRCLEQFDMLLSLKALHAKYDPSGQSSQPAGVPTDIGAYLRKLAA